MEDTNDFPPTNPAPPAIPEYPKMILDAIEALNESGGSNKTAIAQQIESTYSDQLPEAHATLLAHHLSSMTASGDLAFVKNNYLKPDLQRRQTRKASSVRNCAFNRPLFIPLRSSAVLVAPPNTQIMFVAAN